MTTTQKPSQPGSLARRLPAEIAAIVAVPLAWLIPGAGHILLGHWRRGLILLLAVTLTFWSGVAMGGVMTVDRQNEFWWWVGQMFTGGNGLIANHNTNLVRQRMQEDPALRAALGNADATKLTPDEYRKVQTAYEDHWLAEEGIALTAPMDTTARAYSGVAGMLNLMCIFDAVLLSLMTKAGRSTQALAKTSSTLAGKRQPADRERRP